LDTRKHLFVCLLWVVLTGYAVVATSETETQIDQFLVALEGEWVGRAEVTPIGPRSYNIHFKPNPQGLVEGSTGTSTVHYWKFYREQDRLVIRFLSTFANNRKPIFLDAVKWDDQGIFFQARDPALLTLKVSFPTEVLSIDVLHWNQPHVSIRLTKVQ